MKRLLILTAALMLTAGAVGCRCCEINRNPCPAPVYDCPPPCDPCATSCAPACSTCPSPGPQPYSAPLQ